MPAYRGPTPKVSFPEDMGESAAPFYALASASEMSSGQPHQAVVAPCAFDTPASVVHFTKYHVPGHPAARAWVIGHTVLHTAKEDVPGAFPGDPS